MAAAAAAARGLAKRWLCPAAASRAVSACPCSCSCPFSCPCPCPCPPLPPAVARLCSLLRDLDPPGDLPSPGRFGAAPPSLLVSRGQGPGCGHGRAAPPAREAPWPGALSRAPREPAGPGCAGKGPCRSLAGKARRTLILYQQKCAQQHQGSDCAPVLGPAEGTPRVLCPVVGSSIQERHRGAGASPGKGSEGGEGSEHDEERLGELGCSAWKKGGSRELSLSTAA